MKGLVLALFVLLVAGALVFRYERILFCDASYILFRIINLDSLQIQEHRYGSFITQIVPLLGSRAGLSLPTIIALYSVSFNLFYLLIACLLLFVLRARALAILMSLYFLLYVTDVYFWTNNEVHQGIAWMFLFFGVIQKGQRDGWILPVQFPLFLVLSFLAIFTHPLLLFPILYLWFFLVLEKELVCTWKEFILYSVILLLVVGFKVYLSYSEQSHYDVEKLQAATDLSVKKVLGSFLSPMAREIVNRTLWNYWLVPVLFFMGMYSAFRMRKYLSILLTLAFCGTCFAAVCIIFDQFIPFYTESEWMPFSIIAAAPFVYYTLPQLRPRKALILVATIYLVRLSYIGFAAPKFIERKEWVYATLNKMKEQKITKGLVPETEENNKILLMNWGIPTESILASATMGDRPMRTFVVSRPDDLSQRSPGNNHTFMGPFENWSVEQLNSKYFRIDTTRNYRLLK